MKLLITGASGLLGGKLVELALNAGHQVSSIINDHPAKDSEAVRLDLRDAERVRSILTERRPDAVIHTASITDVDFCERNPTLAMEINAKATETIARACNELHSFLVYVSTDYVFDGQTGGYREEDKPNPINTYGRSKLVGEQLTSNLAPYSCIARTSVLFGCGRKYRLNFATWLLESLSRGQSVKVISGQYASPTLNTHLARMLLEVSERRIAGTLHLAGANRINRYEFAIRLAQEFRLNTGLLVPVAPASVNWYAKRPADSSLNIKKATRLLNTKPRTLKDELRTFKIEFQQSPRKTFVPD